MITFDKKGKINTDSVLEEVKKKIQETGIKNIVLATTSGETALKAREIFGENVNIIAVRHCTGLKEANVQNMPEANEKKLQEKNIEILTATHAMGALGRAVRMRLGTYSIDEIIAQTLKVFGDGVKVCMEISLMAADAGLIKTTEDIIAIGGTGKGADSAMRLQAANTHKFFDLKAREIYCKPE